MKPKPMVLVKDCVLNVMAGRQTQDRRIINPQPDWVDGVNDLSFDGIDTFIAHSPELANEDGDVNFIGESVKSRYQVGQQVYVAEGYQINEIYGDGKKSRRINGFYIADGASFRVELDKREWDLLMNRKCKYRPTSGRFMYASLARTFRTIIGVGVERVGDISWEDVEKEGLQVIGNHARRQMFFGMLWDKIHGFGAFSRNDWVFVYEWE